MAGLWCTALGYGNEELIEAAREQLARLSFAHLFGAKSHDKAVELAEKLKAISWQPSGRSIRGSQWAHVPRRWCRTRA
jgi:4-aminobutyrate--pyruvate transaminase